jgi:hypothetical protein
LLAGPGWRAVAELFRAAVQREPNRAPWRVKKTVQKRARLLPEKSGRRAGDQRGDRYHNDAV